MTNFETIRNKIEGLINGELNGLKFRVTSGVFNKLVSNVSTARQPHGVPIEYYNNILAATHLIINGDIATKTLTYRFEISSQNIIGVDKKIYPSEPILPLAYNMPTTEVTSLGKCDDEEARIAQANLEIVLKTTPGGPGVAQHIFFNVFHTLPAYLKMVIEPIQVALISKSNNTQCEVEKEIDNLMNCNGGIKEEVKNMLNEVKEELSGLGCFSSKKNGEDLATTIRNAYHNLVDKIKKDEEKLVPIADKIKNGVSSIANAIKEAIEETTKDDKNNQDTDESSDSQGPKQPLGHIEGEDSSLEDTHWSYRSITLGNLEIRATQTTEKGKMSKIDILIDTSHIESGVDVDVSYVKDISTRKIRPLGSFETK